MSMMPPGPPMMGGGMPPMGGMPPLPMGLGPAQGQMDPNNPIMNPNMDPMLGPPTFGGPEPDAATLERLIEILKVLGVGGAASGIATGPQGQGLPLQAIPGAGMMGGAGPNGTAGPRSGMMVPPGGGPGTLGGGGPNPLISALGGGAAGGF